MPFFEDHYEYILECASVRATEIQRITGIDDTEDWVQDILIHVWKNEKLYDTKRGTPEAFIVMLVQSKKRNILRKLKREKRIQLKYAERL